VGRNPWPPVCAKGYTKTWTVRVDQRILPEEEPIEFICDENQQFQRRIKIDERCQQSG